MNFLRRHTDGVIAALLAAGTFLAVFFHSGGMGITRDESFYFDAAESHAGWFRTLLRAPREALQEGTIDRYYEINHEHPVLVKNLMALAHLAFGPAGRSQSSGEYVRAMRLPTHLNAALLAALVFLFGTSVAGRRAGLLAALLFVLVPRHFYHLHLACFDMPITTAWLAVVMAYRKADGSLRWSILTGLLFGLALSVKHNAFFIPLVLGLHWLIVKRREFSFGKAGLAFPRIPLAFFAMLLLGPLVLWLHWPWLWHHTFERVGFWLGFHLHHINYYWEFFGRLLTDPPFPWGYAFAVTAVTVPLPTLVLMALGLFAALRDRLGPPLARLLQRLRLWRRPAAASPDGVDLARERDDWLLILNGLFPIVLISLPSVPIFGGVKHWLSAMPFLCVLAARYLDGAVARLGGAIAPAARRWIFAGSAALVLLPSLLGLARVGTYGTSFYNELAGGVPGAADLGMQRQYWSNNVTGVLPWLNENLPRGARLYLHEVTGEAFRFYQRDGWLRADVRMAWGPEDADFCAYQYHREFVDAEYRIWNQTGTRRILHGLYLDEVPVILVYDCRRQGAGAIRP
ncbi:MAG: phospholipid carrier-dependent glycosyltransferase [Myxococcales bacterium]|nr:phospholipid carrier-dependent glycosyltransferase [Myxococcales bacterium]